MPGFFISNKKLTIQLKNYYPERCVSEDLPLLDVTAKRNTLNKFLNDKTFVQNNDAILVAEGYLLNKLQLFDEYGVSSVEDLMWKMYQTNGDTFFSAFRGAFSGALYDRSKDKWLVYTNHIGDNPIYYVATDSCVCAGSQVNYVIAACKELGVELTFNESAAYQMLTYAFMADDSTYAKEIRRLRGGTYLLVENGITEVKTYHTFTKSNPERFGKKSEAEIIEELDKAFRNAIELEYAKDEEYGYKHLTDISGGLDSRMNMWVAHTQKPRHLQLLTYCKSNYLDELIAKEIAQYWKDELLIKPLDDCSFLYEIDEIVSMNEGLSIYSGITGGKRMLESLNMDNYGLEHTGMLGDVIIGSWVHSLEDMKKGMPTGRYSEKLVNRLPEDIEQIGNKYQDHELYLFYTRGFGGITATHLIRKNYTEVVSPFLDVEFMQLCFDIPFELRKKHYIYKKWILSKYPDAANFKWESIDAKITEGNLTRGIRRIIKRGPKKFLRMLGLIKHVDTGMNPLDYWFYNDLNLKMYVDAYAQDGYLNTPEGVRSELIEDMQALYRTGNVLEKTMVVTVLASMRLYFGENNAQKN